MKRCAKCSQDRPFDQFYRASKESGQTLHPWCKTCFNQYTENRRKQAMEDPDKAEHLRALSRQRATRDANKLRAEMLVAYGGQCACCAESTPEFLSLDHIDGKGADHRRLITGSPRSGSTASYRWLRKNGWPKDNYQLLCHNCNCAKGFYGHCPHEQPVIGER